MDTDSALLQSATSLGITLKEEQVQVSRSILEGKDVFAVLPTGFGKSICFQCLPGAFDLLSDSPKASIVMIITPLLAIMEDQVKDATSKGLTAASISSLTNEEVKKSVLQGKYQLVFVSPEMLLKSRSWKNAIMHAESFQSNIVAMVFDEAHCIVKWGYSFREELTKVGEIRSIIPSGIPLMALTATATKTVRIEVAKIIGMRDPYLITMNPDKCAIRYEAHAFSSIREEFQWLAMEVKSSGINTPRVLIYCKRIKDCDEIYDYFERELQEQLRNPIDSPDLSKYRLIDKYTSITDPVVKENIIKSFTSPTTGNNLRIVISTIAFGMGVNCCGITKVFHVGPPDECSDYIQQCGRASRRGEPTNAILMYSKLYNRTAAPDMKAYCALSNGCRRNALFEEFDNYTQPSIHATCLCCDLCEKICSGCNFCR